MDKKLTRQYTGLAGSDMAIAGSDDPHKANLFVIGNKFW